MTMNLGSVPSLLKIIISDLEKKAFLDKDNKEFCLLHMASFLCHSWVIVLSFSLLRQHRRERREEMGVEVVIPAFAGVGDFWE
jgi:hypothetical protein